MTRINVILAVIALLLAIPVGWHLMQEGQRFTVWSEEPLLFEGLDPDDIALVGYGIPARGSGAVSPGDPNDPVQRDRVMFRKQSDQWVLHEGPLAGAPVIADQVIGGLVEFVRPIRSRDADVMVRDASAQQLDDYGVSRKNARVVSLLRSDQSELATLYVGNYIDEASSSRGLAGYYVRNSTGTDILFYERPRWDPPLDPNAWLDRTVHRLESGEIVGLRFTGPRSKGDVEFARDPEKIGLWIAPQKPDQARDIRHSDVTDLVQRFADIRAERIVGPSSMAAEDALKYGLSTPYVFVQATMEDGSVHRLVVGNQVERSPYRYAIGGDARWLVTIPSHAFDGFERDPVGSLFTAKQ